MTKPPCLDFRTQSNLSDSSVGVMSCCKMFNELFNLENLENIMKIMKFSHGGPLPRSLNEIFEMPPKDYEQIFPSSEYLTSLKNMRYVSNNLRYILIQIKVIISIIHQQNIYLFQYSSVNIWKTFQKD